MKKSISQFGLASMLLIMSNSLFAQKTTISYNKGQKIKITTIVNSSNTAEAMGQSMVTDVSTTISQNVEILSSNANETEMSAVITSLKLGGSAMGQDFNYDSDKTDNDEKMTETLGKVTNNKTTFTIDASGKIVKESAEKKINTPQGQMAMMAGGGTENNLNSVYLSSAIGLELKVGSTWMDSTETKGDLSKKLVNTYTIKSIENGVAVIDIKGTESITGTVTQMGMEMAMSGTTSITGILKIKVLNALIMEKTTAATLTSSVDAGGMTIPVTGTINTKSTTIIE